MNGYLILHDYASWSIDYAFNIVRSCFDCIISNFIEASNVKENCFDNLLPIQYVGLIEKFGKMFYLFSSEGPR